MSVKLFGLLLVALMLGAAGQLLMKMALESYKSAHGQIVGFGMLFQAMLRIGVVVGLGCYVLSSVLYIKLLADMPVSQLYPMVALNYIFVTILDRYVLHQPVPLMRVVGLGIIILGVVTVALSSSPQAAMAEAFPVEQPLAEQAAPEPPQP
ncbi:MAG: EamA family transporter [Armatimonadetes bacterium]|nr:EamA family transporter [Armatimonadota bacterium]